MPINSLYGGTVGMLLQIKVKCTIGKLKSSGLLSQSVIVADSKVKVKIWRFDILSWINKWFKTSIKVLYFMRSNASMSSGEVLMNPVFYY